MRKVLMVTTIFPPRSGVGALRTLKFAKYLKSFGWQPIILTPTVYLGKKEKPVIEKIPDRIIVYRTFWPTVNNCLKLCKDKISSGSQQNKGLSYTVSVAQATEKKLTFRKKIMQTICYFEKIICQCIFIDYYILWLPSALFKGIKIVKKESIDVIYSTVPEFTSHILAFCLKILTKKPWVADYRDIWTGGLFRPRWIFPAIVGEKIEKLILSQADVITVISEPMRDM